MVPLEGSERRIFGAGLYAATTTIAALIILTAGPVISLQAQTFTILHNFTGGADGGNPYTGLTIDRAGHLYGTSAARDLGTIFKLSSSGPGWTLSTLYNFLGGAEGNYPDSNVIFGPDGRLYSATTEGGNPGCNGYGCGIVLALRPRPHASSNVLEEWSESVLYSFLGGTDGSSPAGLMAFDQAGALYGADQVGVNGWGAIYKLTPSAGNWSQSVLYNFSGGNDGGGPLGGILMTPSGTIFGTTAGGGTYGNGVVYSLTVSNGAWTETPLYSFQGPNDGNFPVGGLISDAAGNLYGTTLYGGSGNGGTVFMLSPANGSWTFSVLYSLVGPAGSFGALAMDPAGNLYGTTGADGAFRHGNVFKLTRSQGGWIYTSLHDFSGGADGDEPFGNVVLDVAGNIYGTTHSGGSKGAGVIFEITP